MDILQEAGEAIGNVGRRLLGRRRKGRVAEQALARWLARVPLPVVRLDGERQARPADEVIEGTFRVIESEKGESQ
jgi:hypothetical protein